MYECMHVGMCECMCVCLYVHIYVFYVYMLVSIFAHMYVCLYVFMYVCMYVCTYVCTHICKYVVVTVLTSQDAASLIPRWRIWARKNLFSCCVDWTDDVNFVRRVRPLKTFAREEKHLRAKLSNRQTDRRIDRQTDIQTDRKRTEGGNLQKSESNGKRRV
jgi:hypothetical protein